MLGPVALARLFTTRLQCQHAHSPFLASVEPTIFAAGNIITTAVIKSYSYKHIGEGLVIYQPAR